MKDNFTHIIPWFRHEARKYTVFHANTLRQVFEQDRVVRHPQGIVVRQGRLKNTGTGFSI